MDREYNWSFIMTLQYELSNKGYYFEVPNPYTPFVCVVLYIITYFV